MLFYVLIGSIARCLFLCLGLVYASDLYQQPSSKSSEWSKFSGQNNGLVGSISIRFQLGIVFPMGKCSFVSVPP